tara:strand:- start:986 stop:1195 length:210 start_codon:yes stop_codon:yes gene_type:complete
MSVRGEALSIKTYVSNIPFLLNFNHSKLLFASVSMYADREYYEDWWNSTTWDEFARKWNKQVWVEAVYL